MSITKSNSKFFAAAAILLAILLIIMLPAQKIAAAEEQPKALYISKVRLGYGKTVKEAAAELKDYEILKNGDNYANLNEGSGKDTVVLLGYQTTTNRSEAVTDIAAMNMKGGYSFTEYDLLMAQYRDSQITPFLNRFMTTVKEYRLNYNSENPANKAKAQFAHDLLNLFKDDDTEMLMGDFLLKMTAEEYGIDKYEKLSDDEKKQYGSLTTILMQGETSTVFMIEQLVTMAADTNDTTWLQRFEGVTPESLLQSAMADGTGETDARNALARKYEDTARLLSEKWAYFRDSLIRYDQAVENEDIGIEFDPDDVPVPEEPDEAVTEEMPSPKELLEGLSTNEAIETILLYTKEQVEMAEAIDDVKIAVAYNYLKNTKYGDGTMYDYFTRNDDAVTQNDYFELYPIVSVLTEGQITGIDFMNLNQLVQYGIAIGDSYVEMNKDLADYIKSVSVISVYQGVNRDLFSKGTALTDEEMRTQAANSTQLFGDSQSAAFGRAGVFAAIGIASGFGAGYCISKVMKSFGTSVLKLTESETQNMQKFFNAVNDFEKYTTAVAEKDTVAAAEYIGRNIKEATYAINDEGQTVLKLVVGSPKSELGFIEVYTIPKGVNYDAEKSIFENADDIAEKVGFGREGAKSIGGKIGTIAKAGLGTVFSIVFLGLSVYSIYSSAMEIYNYYNVDMTKVPKYIVDRADLTEIDANGNTLVHRNDSAYYEAVTSNRSNFDKFYQTMINYGDVNAAEGRQWLVLYVNKDLSVKHPVLADSLKVVTGRSDIPEGYNTGVHLFGESTAVNMSDKRYCYDDKLGGIYVYFKNEPDFSTSTGTGTVAQTDSKDAPSTSSSFGFGYMALAGIGGAVAGFALGVCVVMMIKRKKETEAVRNNDSSTK